MDDETLTNYSDAPRPPRSGDTISSGNFGEPDLSGTALDNYVLIRKIAEGGMGVVYEAVQSKLSRKVALKVLTDKLSTRPEFFKRFEREAKATAALNHPNLVQVYDFGEALGRHYMVMEFIEGEDLAQYVERAGKLPVDQALTVVEQAAQALKAACAKSIIHRDIKPSNLMLTSEGTIKVADMGLAKILTESSDMTATGVGMGSPHFIAPEQADDSRNVDHRADIYALGLTLLYILTGKKPFDGGTPFSVVLAHVNKPLPSGIDLGTELPAEVEVFIRRMAAKKPNDRYQDYDSLLADLQNVRAGIAPVSVTTEEVPTKTFSKTWLAVGAVCLVAVALLAVFLKRPASSSKKYEVVSATPATEQTHPTPLEFEERGQPEGERGPPDRPEGREDAVGGPPTSGDSVEKHIALILPPFPEVTNLLEDGPVEKMFAAAEKYAAEHPANFLDILAGYQQVSAKEIGSPTEAKAKEAIRSWTARRDAAAAAAIKEYKAKAQELSKNSSHRAAMDYVRTFPPQLRSPDVDIRVFQGVALPPPGQQQRGGDRGQPQQNRRQP